MTATAHSVERPQRGMKALAGALAVVCAILFLLAIEQRDAVAAWEAMRREAAPAAARLLAGVERAAAVSAERLRTAAPTPTQPPPLAPAGEDAILTGGFAAADEATRLAVGGASFDGALIRFDSGETLRTSPDRIAPAGEPYAPGRSYARRWRAPADAQVELRTIAAESAPATRRLCRGEAPGTVALLHRRERVDLMLFTAAGSGDPIVCNVWSFERR